MRDPREVKMQKLQHDSRPSPGEGAVYRLVFATSYVVFLAVGAMQRLVPWQGARAAHDADRRSIFAEASRAAGTVTPFAFMG